MSSERNEHAILLEWMKGKGPREWHQVATTWNWDGGYNILEWLIEQPTLDRGTAVSLFFLASPDYFLRYSNRDAVIQDASWSVENFDFISRLVGFADRPDYYTTAQFCSHEIVTKDLVDEYVSQQNELPKGERPWTASQKLLSVMDGEIVDVEGFVEGYPAHIWNAVEDH